MLFGDSKKWNFTSVSNTFISVLKVSVISNNINFLLHAFLEILILQLYIPYMFPSLSSSLFSLCLFCDCKPWKENAETRSK